MPCISQTKSHPNRPASFRHALSVEDHPEVQEWANYSAFVDGITGVTWRYGEFLQRIENAAGALAAPANAGGLEIVKDQRVGVLSENCIDYATITWALFKLASPIVLLPASATVPEVISLAKLVNMTHIFVSPTLLPQAIAIAAALGLSPSKILILQGCVTGYRSLDDLVSIGRRFRTGTRDVQHNTPAYIMFSSGTSGRPKAIMSSHMNLYYSCMQPSVMIPLLAKLYPPKSLGTAEGIPVSIGFAPLYHILGFCVSIARCFLGPSTVVMIPKWNTELVFKLISKWKVGSLSLVPAYVHMMVHSPLFQNADLSSIGSVSCGAAFLPVELRQRFASRLSIPWWAETFGMSELTGAALMAVPPGILDSKVDPKPGVTGILLPNFEGRIVRDDATDTDYGEAGELWLKGPAVALGYYNDESATETTFLSDGWMRTGDCFTMDEAGRFYYVERVKDTLKVSGTQVSPSEIEDKLLEQPDGMILDVAVAGVASTRMQDELVPRAWIVLSEKGKSAGAETAVHLLDMWIREQLSKPKWLRGGIEIVDEIPKSATGKVLRRILQTRHMTEDTGAKAKL